MNVMLAAESKSLAELVERLNRQDQLSADQTAGSVLSAPTATFGLAWNFTRNADEAKLLL